MLDNEDLASLYEKRYKIDMFTNQYLFIKNQEGRIIAKHRWDGEELISLKYKKIKSNRFGEVYPLNDEQEALFDLLQNSNITVKQIIKTTDSH